MRKKRNGIAVLLFGMGVVLTACGKNPEVLLSYEEQINMTESVTAEEQEVPKLFYEDICVVSPKDAEDTDENLTVASGFLVNLSENKSEFASEIYTPLYPASITKILTAYVALQQGDLTETVTISHNAANLEVPGAKKCGFAEGDKISLEALLTSFLVYSGNDAGVAIAEHIAGSEEAFVELMNQAAKELGATQSHFCNPHGLHEDDHYTTCYDVYLIFSKLIQNETFLSMISHGSYEANYMDAVGNEKTATFTSTNRYLADLWPVPEDVTVFGGKTGTTNEAGSCLILYFEKQGTKYLGFLFHAQDGDQCFTQMSYLMGLANE